MYGYHVAAVFSTYDGAERARDGLVDEGIPEGNIHLSHDSPYEDEERQPQGFWDWLFGGSSPRRDREWYRNNLTGGRTAVSVLVPEDHDHIWIAEQLVAAGALNLEDEEDTSITAKSIRGRQGTRPRENTEDRRLRGSDEQVIPIEREQLDIGKRATENRYRVRAHVVEQPVEKDVRLRDDRYIMEQQPASGEHTGRPGEFQDRDYEMVERHEEPVVRKTRSDEELVIRKQPEERTEKVVSTVRDTRVDVDRNEGDLPAPSRDVNPDAETWRGETRH